jgi:hypothetical protein
MRRTAQHSTTSTAKKEEKKVAPNISFLEKHPDFVIRYTGTGCCSQNCVAVSQTQELMTCFGQENFQAAVWK